MSDPEINAFVFGAVSGLAFGAVVFALLLQVMKPKKHAPPGRVAPRAGKLVPLLIAVFFVALTLVQVAPAAAQTPVPIPTLDIPIASLFSQTNFWMGTLSPVISVAVGAGIAVGILLFVAAIIKGSFRSLG